jgi:hypothetical protein
MKHLPCFLVFVRMLATSVRTVIRRVVRVACRPVHPLGLKTSSGNRDKCMKLDCE